MEGGRKPSVVVLLLALLIGGPQARAADQAILGAKLLVKDPTGDPARRRLVVMGREDRGSNRWQQAHDSSNNHAASFWWKTRSLGASGPDLIAGLPAS